MPAVPIPFDLYSYRQVIVHAFSTVYQVDPAEMVVCEVVSHFLARQNRKAEDLLSSISTSCRFLLNGKTGFEIRSSH